MPLKPCPLCPAWAQAEVGAQPRQPDAPPGLAWARAEVVAPSPQPPGPEAAASLALDRMEVAQAPPEVPAPPSLVAVASMPSVRGSAARWRPALSPWWRRLLDRAPRPGHQWVLAVGKAATRRRTIPAARPDPDAADSGGRRKGRRSRLVRVQRGCARAAAPRRGTVALATVAEAPPPGPPRRGAEPLTAAPVFSAVRACHPKDRREPRDPRPEPGSQASAQEVAVAARRAEPPRHPADLLWAVVAAVEAALPPRLPPCHPGCSAPKSLLARGSSASPAPQLAAAEAAEAAPEEGVAGRATSPGARPARVPASLVGPASPAPP